MLTAEEYKVREESFLAYKDTLTKEPSGDVKKEYYVGCYQKSDWEFIHEEFFRFVLIKHQRFDLRN